MSKPRSHRIKKQKPPAQALPAYPDFNELCSVMPYEAFDQAVDETKKRRKHKIWMLFCLSLPI